MGVEKQFNSMLLMEDLVVCFGETIGEEKREKGKGMREATK